MIKIWMVMDSMLTTPSSKIHNSKTDAISLAKQLAYQNKRSFIVFESIGSASYLSDPTVYSDAKEMED